MLSKQEKGNAADLRRMSVVNQHHAVAEAAAVAVVAAVRVPRIPNLQRNSKQQQQMKLMIQITIVMVISSHGNKEGTGAGQ